MFQCYIASFLYYISIILLLVCGFGTRLKKNNNLKKKIIKLQVESVYVFL